MTPLTPEQKIKAMPKTYKIDDMEELPDIYFEQPSGRAVSVIKLPNGYSFRQFAKWAGYVLCFKGKIVRCRSKYNPRGWNMCIAEPGWTDALTQFATAIAQNQMNPHQKRKSASNSPRKEVVAA